MCGRALKGGGRKRIQLAHSALWLCRRRVGWFLRRPIAVSRRNLSLNRIALERQHPDFVINGQQILHTGSPHQVVQSQAIEVANSNMSLSMGVGSPGRFW